MPIINGIYLDITFDQRYVVLSISKESTQDWVKVIWLPKQLSDLSASSTFPFSAMSLDVYCGQASELMLALL